MSGLKRKLRREAQKKTERALDLNEPVTLEVMPGLSIETKYGGAVVQAKIDRLRRVMMLEELKRVLKIQEGFTIDQAPDLFDKPIVKDGAPVTGEDGEPEVEKFYSPEFTEKMVEFLIEAGRLLVNKVSISRAKLAGLGIKEIGAEDPIVRDGVKGIDALVSTNLIAPAVEAAIAFQTPSTEQDF
jgi:hypothetical protein